MKLHNLQKNPGSYRRKKRVGCGVGSGNGKTSGRGHKGQRARSGASLREGFESGHIPLYRKLPMRGFSNYRFRKEYSVLNVSDLERVEGDVADREALIKAGLIRSNAGLVKVLGQGEISKALTVTADKFSASARSKIEAAGGTVNETGAAETAPASSEEGADK